MFNRNCVFVPPPGTSSITPINLHYANFHDNLMCDLIGFVLFIYFFVNCLLVRRFYDKRDAEDALEAMDGRMLDGRELRVQMARYGRPTSPQTRRGGRDRGDRRDRGGGGGGGGGGRR